MLVNNKSEGNKMKRNTLLMAVMCFMLFAGDGIAWPTRIVMLQFSCDYISVSPSGKYLVCEKGTGDLTLVNTETLANTFLANDQVGNPAKHWSWSGDSLVSYQRSSLQTIILDVSGFTNPATKVLVKRNAAKNILSNSPNPFPNTTTIEYTTPIASIVNLTVYSADGSLVKTLVDEMKDKGNHSIQWKGIDESGNTMAAGVYYYQIKGAKILSTEKMILVK